MAATGNTARIERALRYWLGQLVLSPTRPIAEDGAKYEPAVGFIYLEPCTLWNPSRRGEIGQFAARRHVGIYQVLVRGPLTGNPEPQTEVADAIIDHFDRKNISHAGVLVRVGSFDGGRSVPWRGGAIKNDGWRLIPVSVPFWCDVFPT